MEKPPTFFDDGPPFEYPDELKFGLRTLLSPRRLFSVIKDRREYMDLHYPALRPLYDRGGPVSIYQGPSGPIVTLAKIQRNVASGRPPGEGLPPDPLNNPDSP
jgi:hypothetical protein